MRARADAVLNHGLPIFADAPGQAKKYKTLSYDVRDNVAVVRLDAPGAPVSAQDPPGTSRGEEQEGNRVNTQFVSFSLAEPAL